MKRARIVYLVLVALLLVGVVVALVFLPDAINIHWTTGGTQKGSKYYLLAMPCIAFIAWFAMPSLVKKGSDKRPSFINQALGWGLIPLLALFTLIWILNA